MARALVEDHGGEVPRTMEELVALPGVGRKTANVVLGNAFSIDEGVVVDTHVRRLSNRLGFTSAERPGEDREGPHPDGPQGGLDGLLAPPDPARPQRLQGPQTGLRDCVVNDLCPSAFKV